LKVTVRKQSTVVASSPNSSRSPLICPNELTDELIRRGLDYATRRTPGIWCYNVRGEIISYPDNATSTTAAPTTVAHVTENSDGVSIADTTFIVEAVNHYPLALVELINARTRERMHDRKNEERQPDVNAEDIRRELRAMITRAMNGDGQIDARDLYALAEMPIVEMAEEEFGPDQLICETCNKYNHRALQTSNAQIRGPVRICECTVRRTQT
jgi:hypothetical protein